MSTKHEVFAKLDELQDAISNELTDEAILLSYQVSGMIECLEPNCISELDSPDGQYFNPEDYY